MSAHRRNILPSNAKHEFLLTIVFCNTKDRVYMIVVNTNQVDLVLYEFCSGVLIVFSVLLNV